MSQTKNLRLFWCNLEKNTKPTQTKKKNPKNQNPNLKQQQEIAWTALNVQNSQNKKTTPLWLLGSVNSKLRVKFLSL